MNFGGWYQVAFERDLTSDVSSTMVGERRLLIVRTSDGVGVFDGLCPHRGFDLGHGAKLLGAHSVKCPYHGYSISLGRDGSGFCVRRYPSFMFEGLIFALIGEFEAGKLPGVLADMSRSHKVFHGFETVIRAPAEVVMENPFDWTHFIAVHNLLGVKHSEPMLEDGVLVGTNRLKVKSSAWQGSADGSGTLEVPLVARIYSPGVSIVQIALGGGDHPHYVIGSAVPRKDGTSILRLSLALPRNADGSEPPSQVADVLLEFEKRGVEQDRVMWENSDPSFVPSLTAEDRGIIAYRRFCERFSLDSKRRAA